MEMRVLRAVLRNPGLRRLALGFSVFSMAEHATWIAILVFAYGRGALLRDTPRTATVRAASDVELLSLAREPFLLALTGHRASRRTAESVADHRLSGGSSSG